MLRAVDVYVLERGAIEQYYPDTITGADKPSRAQNFCANVATRDAILSCCGDQNVESGGVQAKQKEFNLIFEGIFGKPPNCSSLSTCGIKEPVAEDAPLPVAGKP